MTRFIPGNGCMVLIILSILTGVIIIIISRNEKFANGAEIKKVTDEPIDGVRPMFRTEVCNPSFITYGRTTNECLKAKDNPDLCGFTPFQDSKCKDDNCLVEPTVSEEGALPTQGNIGSILAYCGGQNEEVCTNNSDLCKFPVPTYNPGTYMQTSGAATIPINTMGQQGIGGAPFTRGEAIDKSLLSGPTVQAMDNFIWGPMKEQFNIKQNSDRSKMNPVWYTNCRSYDPYTGARSCMSGQGIMSGLHPQSSLHRADGGVSKDSHLREQQTLGCYRDFWPSIVEENDQCRLLPRYPQPPTYGASGVLKPEYNPNVDSQGAPMCDVLSPRKMCN